MSVTEEQHVREALSLVRAAMQHLDALYEPLPGAVANLTVAEREIRVRAAADPATTMTADETYDDRWHTIYELLCDDQIPDELTHEVTDKLMEMFATWTASIPADPEPEGAVDALLVELELSPKVIPRLVEMFRRAADPETP